jgi:cytochrome P450
MIEYRRSNPGDDMISALIKAEEKDDALSSEEIFSMTVLLLVAGNETTTNLLANGVRQLLLHPEVEQKLRASPERIPDFIEEVLRFDSPVLGLFRTVTEDTSVGGQKIPAGSFVLPFFASANRDSRRFPNGGQFDMDRDASGHIAFGYGIHFCLGAPLARLEATIAIEELLNRLPSLKGDLNEIEWVNSFILRAPKRLNMVNTAISQRL